MNNDTKREPRFDVCLKYGKAGEVFVDRLLKLVASQDKAVEVKRKTRPDLQLYVETHCDYGRRGEFTRSGIHTTEASHWAYVVADTGICIFIPTDVLEVMLNDPSSVAKQETDGDCPTKGKLVNLNVLVRRLKERSAALATAPAPSCPTTPKTPASPKDPLAAKIADRITHELAAHDIKW